jgi:hypothetical protein
MKMRRIILFLISIFCFSTLYSQKYLFIEGQNIWVRETPARGKVIMKLNTDDKCTILQIGQSETIRGNYDYWYKISYDDKIGWVFGSQTSIKTEESKYNLIFSKQIKEFVELLRTDSKKIQKYFHPKYSLYYIQSGSGAYQIYHYSSSIDTILNKGYYLNEYLESLSELQKIPLQYYDEQIDKCAFDKKACYINNKDCTFSRISSIDKTILVSFENIDIDSKEFQKTNRYKELERKIKFEKQITREVTIGTGYHAMTFYFLREGDRWYLVVIDSNSCGA